MTRIAFIEATGAFLLAATWSLLVMPAVISFGRRKGFVSRPRLFGRRKRRTITYLGGLALAGTTAVGLSLSGALAGETAVILGGATVLLILGFADDRTDGGIAPAGRLAAETGVAWVAWLGGLRTEVFGIEWVDGLLTVFFLVAVVNAFNLLDNMDGVAGACASTAAATLFLIAAVRGQHLVTILAAAVAGASLGFLRHNLMRARVYLGNGGALFLGFLLGATALKLQLPFQAPWGFVALLSVFAVPATDTSVVIFSRLLHGRKIFEGATDHLSHRLVHLGSRPPFPAIFHALGTAGAGAVALIAVKSDRPLILAAIVGLYSALGLAFVAVPIYGQRMQPHRPAILVGVAALAGAVVVPAVVLGMQARRDLETARGHLTASEQAIERLEVERAVGSLDAADVAMKKADGKLSSPWIIPARLVPGLSGNLSVSRALAQSGLEIVAAGREAITVLRSLPTKDGRIAPPWKDGRLDLAPFVQARQPAQRVQERIERAHSIVSSARGFFLVPQVREARDSALKELEKAKDKADAAAGSAFLLPRFLGAEGKRTWLIGAENTAELRGRGGYIGAFGLLEAREGSLDLLEVRPTTSLPKLKTSLVRKDAPREYLSHYRRVGGLVAWPNLNASPQFSSGALLWLRGLERQEGINADGVVSMDPMGLSMLLDVTGPIKVEGIPELITSENADDWTLNRAYFEFKSDVRKETQAQITEAVWKRVVSGEDIDTEKLAEVVGRMLAGRHLVVFSEDPKEQNVIERLGIAGSVDKAEGDYLMVVSNNLGENKLDYYLTRKASYRGEVTSDGSLNASLDLVISNTAPSDGPIPQSVGGERARLALEERRSRSYLTVFVPDGSRLQEVRVDGKATNSFDQLSEFGHTVFATYVELGPGESQTVQFRYRVPDVIVGGRYKLRLQNQATVQPDQLSVKVSLPPSAVLGLREGFAPTGNLAWEGPVTQSMNLQAEVALPLQSRILARLSEALRTPVLYFGR